MSLVSKKPERGFNFQSLNVDVSRAGENWHLFKFSANEPDISYGKCHVVVCINVYDGFKYFKSSTRFRVSEHKQVA